MGGQISKMMGKIFGSKEMRLLMLGLDAAGKTRKLLLTWRLEGNVVEWSHARHLRASPAQISPSLCCGQLLTRPRYQQSFTSSNSTKTSPPSLPSASTSKQ